MSNFSIFAGARAPPAPPVPPPMKTHSFPYTIGTNVLVLETNALKLPAHTTTHVGTSWGGRRYTVANERFSAGDERVENVRSTTATHTQLTTSYYQTDLLSTGLLRYRSGVVYNPSFLVLTLCWKRTR